MRERREKEEIIKREIASDGSNSSCGLQNNFQLLDALSLTFDILNPKSKQLIPTAQ